MNQNNRLGLLGRKIGMMRLFAEDGLSIPVTVIDVSTNRIAQVKTVAGEGYFSLQVAFGARRSSCVNKPEAGHLANFGVESCEVLREFRLNSGDAFSSLKSGGVLLASDIFVVDAKIDVTGVSIGKGFQGTIKRHNFGSQRASHGNSRSHRVPGSISMAQDPGRVFPGKKMSGHMGDVTKTVQNLSIVRIDNDRQLLFVKGAVPGFSGGIVVVRPAVKFLGRGI